MPASSPRDTKDNNNNNNNSGRENRQHSNSLSVPSKNINNDINNTSGKEFFDIFDFGNVAQSSSNVTSNVENDNNIEQDTNTQNNQNGMYTVFLFRYRMVVVYEITCIIVVKLQHL